MSTFYYRTNEDRAAIVSQQQSQGLTLIHDDFNAGPNGEHRLSFDVDSRASPPRTRLGDLRDTATQRDLTLAELNEAWRLERGL